VAGVAELLEDRRVCICAGSGGVGKTTTSAAIAAGMAARGKKVAVLTIDPAKRLADSLGLPELGNTERRVDPSLFTAAGVDSGEGELWAMMLDSKATFDEVVRKHAPDEETQRRRKNARDRWRRLAEWYVRVLDEQPSKGRTDHVGRPAIQSVEGEGERRFG